MKNLSNIVLSLAVVVVLTSGGYFLFRQWEADLPELDPQDGYLVNVAAGKDLTFREVIQTRHEDVEGTGGCDVKLLYPQIEDVSGALTVIQDSINAQITVSVKEFLTTDGDEDLDHAATSFVSSCKADLTDLVAQMDDPIESAQQAWTSEVGYDIKQNANGILSIGLSNYLNQGGAHPNITQLFLNFDVKTGKQLSLRDIIGSTRLTAFEVKEKQWLIDNNADQLFEESLSEFNAYVANPTDEQTHRYIDDAIFYTTPEAIGIFYNPYLIAPYVAGPIAVEIMRSEL
ncbi:MAG: DUF4163 domain-containing protein [Patescibacteria group bacterium]